MKLAAKRKTQITVDVLMTCIMLLQMSYSIAGEFLHEILGIVLFCLFIVHHVLSYSYTKALFKGKRTAEKIFSAVPISKHVFTFLDASSLSSVGRIVHLLGVYWGFALMSLHLGFHLDYLLPKALKKKRPAAIIMALLSIAGLICFIHEGIYRYMLLINQFVFFDTTGGLPLFLLKYILIAAMFATVGYGIISLTKRRRNEGTTY